MTDEVFDEVLDVLLDAFAKHGRVTIEHEYGRRVVIARVTNWE